MIKPTIHLNGTSREALSEEYENALYAVQDAIQAVRNITVNGRDYYPQGPNAYTTAELEHNVRLDRLTKVEEELMEILLHLRGA